MRAEIKELHKSMQTTFVYVTHDQAEALTLADRIVVMRDGLVQQIGTPTAIYEQPVNMFVASFLGNPPINYLHGEIIPDGDGAAFQRGELKLLFDEELAASMQSYTGCPVVLGIRPEDVDEQSPQTHGTLHIAGRVRSVLPVGSDQYLGMRVEGVDLFFRVGKDRQHRDDELLTLTLKPKRLHLFDPQSQRSLLRS